jgi:CDP-6-deoxy-D-xylo-4-hexulose-3-dehydrase
MIAHSLGNPFDVERVAKFCKQNNLYLIEDCCDAFGALVNGKHVGTFGDVATLSFYPAHHITMGEGGAVLVNNPLLAKTVESFRDWGRIAIASRASTTPATSVSAGAWATCPRAMTTNIPTAISAII